SLAYHQIGFCTSHYRVVGITGAFRSLEIPDYRYFGMMALNGVADLSVCIGFQITIFDAVLQEIREFRFTCHLREIFGRKYSSPSSGSYQVNIAVVNHLFRKALPECKVNE